MNTTRTLRLRREVLTELTEDQLVSVVGATGTLCDTIGTATDLTQTAITVASFISRCPTCVSCGSSCTSSSVQSC